MKPLSEEVELGLLVIQIQIQAVWEEAIVIQEVEF